MSSSTGFSLADVTLRSHPDRGTGRALDLAIRRLAASDESGDRSMQGTTMRYYTFVSQFVGSVTNEALSTELHRSLHARRLFEKAHLGLTEATGRVPQGPRLVTDKAA